MQQQGNEKTSVRVMNQIKNYPQLARIDNRHDPRLKTVTGNFLKITMIVSGQMSDNTSYFTVLAFARGDVVFIFSFKIFYFLYRTGRYWIYFTVAICILSNNCKQIDY